MTYLLIQFFLALFATLGFAIIFRVPKRDIPACVIVGACGWIAYQITVAGLDSSVMACFVGACVVGVLSTACSYMLKEAATIFVIPGILCLVPGSHIFRTMEALLLQNLEKSAEIGLQTLFMAGAIAVGLLVVGALFGTLRSLIKKTANLKDRMQ